MVEAEGFAPAVEADDDVARFVVEDFPSGGGHTLMGHAPEADHFGFGELAAGVGLFEIGTAHPTIEEDVLAFPIVADFLIGRGIGLMFEEVVLVERLEEGLASELVIEVAGRRTVDTQRLLDQ